MGFSLRARDEDMTQVVEKQRSGRERLRLAGADTPVDAYAAAGRNQREVTKRRCPSSFIRMLLFFILLTGPPFDHPR